MSVTGFLKNGKIEKYDYNALDNKPSGSGGTGLTEEAKQALLTCFQKVAYIDANGQTYYQALYDALNATPKVLTSIDAAYTQSGEVLTTDALDSLRKDIVVTAYYNDSTSATVTDYMLSGNLTAGTSTVTISYNGMSDTISVTVTAVAGMYTVSNHLTGCTSSNSATTIAEGGSYAATITANSGYTLTGATASVTMGGNTVTGAYSNGTISIANVTGDIVITVTAATRTVSSISAVFNQGDNVVYTTDSLNSLKQYLAVTATYSDGGAEAVSDYTLSGTMEEGTSTITVSYGGKTTMFNVTVTEYNTTAVISQENVFWNNKLATTSRTGYGITKWYDFTFSRDRLENSGIWNSTNEYMTRDGWTAIRYCVPSYLSTVAGNAWPTSNVAKHATGKDGVYTSWMSISSNVETNYRFGRNSKAFSATNCWSATIPLNDIDYCFAYWYKSDSITILPDGVSNGDIIFAGKYTPYYNLKNANDAPELLGISPTFNQTQIVTPETTLSDLKPMLAISAQYSDGKELPVNLGMVALSGTLVEGDSTITATYNEKSTNFIVNVTASGA